MTGTLKELRAELLENITQLTTYDHIPGRVNLPCAFIAAGAPYISAGQTMGSRTVRFNLIILTGPALNGIQTDELDKWIEEIQAVLEADGWTVESVQQPQINDLGDQEVLATTINVATAATF